MNRFIELEMLRQLIPYDSEGLHKIRLGKNSDGAYVLPKEVIMPCQAYLSFGIANDISFEEALLDFKALPIYCYDPTINQIPESKKFSKYYHYFKQGLIGRDLMEYILLKRKKKINKTYPFFEALIDVSSFSKAVKKQYIQISNEIIYDWDLTTIEEIIEKQSLQNKKIGIKMDIEVSEYEALKNFNVNILDQVQFFIIEFHHLHMPYFIEEAYKVLQTLLKKLTLVHVHPNNISVNKNIDGISYHSVMECTFINNDFVKNKYLSIDIHPSKYDRECSSILSPSKSNYIEKLSPYVLFENIKCFDQNKAINTPIKENAIKKLILKLLPPLAWLVKKFRYIYNRLNELEQKIQGLEEKTLLQDTLILETLFPNLKNHDVLSLQNINYKSIQILQNILNANKNIKTIFEMEVGISTIIIASMLKNYGSSTQLISIDYSKKRIVQVQEVLKSLGLDTYVKLELCPLKEFIIENKTLIWYDIKDMKLPKVIDLLLISDVLEELQTDATFTTIPLLAEYFSDNTKIIVEQLEDENFIRDILTRWDKYLLSKNKTSIEHYIYRR